MSATSSLSSSEQSQSDDMRQAGGGMVERIACVAVAVAVAARGSRVSETIDYILTMSKHR